MAKPQTVTGGGRVAERDHILSAIPVDRRPLKYGISASILAFGAIGVVAVFPLGLVTTTVGATVVVIVCATTVPMTIWFARFDIDALWWSPSTIREHWRSLAFVAWADVGTSCVQLSVTNPLLGLLGAVLFAPLGGVAAFFGTRTGLLLHTLLVNTYLGVMAWRLIDTQATPSTAIAIGAAGCGAIGLNSTTLLLAVFSRAVKKALRVLRQSIDTDPLTGVLNRRGFEFHATQLASGASASTTLTVIAIDIDRYKNFNDAHGHRRGDEALVKIAECLASAPPPIFVGRLGGDEFAVITLHRDPPLAAEAIVVAVRKRQRLRSHRQRRRSRGRRR